MKKELKITKDLTPKVYLNACYPLPACPAVFETNKDSYAIIGKKLDAKNLKVDKRVGKDEVLIEIPKNIIDNKRI